MIDFLIFGVFLAAAASASNFRVGFTLCVIAGLVQDPIRKSIVGEPVLLTALAAGLFGLAFLAGRARGLPLKLSALHFWGDPSVRVALETYIGVVVLMCGVTLARTGSVFLATLGLVAYLAPLPALLGGNLYFRGPEDARRYIRLYLAGSIPMLAGIYLSYAGYTWQILDSVGYGLWVYGQNEAVRLHSGFFRAPEIAAWHAGHAIILILIDLVVFSRKGMRSLLAAPLVLGLLGAMLLTGRRKFLGELVIFIVAYALLLFWLGRGPSRLTKVLGPIVIAAMVLTQLSFFKDAKQSSFAFFLQRGATTADDAPQRYSTFFESIRYIRAQNGLFGSGAGVGSQGSQYLGLSGDFGIGQAAETGPGKVLAEMGIQGIFVILLLLYRLARYAVRTLRQLGGGDPLRLRLICGLTALLIANGTVFFAAHQVYGDPFILLNLGWIAGFIVAIPGTAPAAVPQTARQAASLAPQRERLFLAVTR